MANIPDHFNSIGSSDGSGFTTDLPDSNFKYVDSSDSSNTTDWGKELENYQEKYPPMQPIPSTQEMAAEEIARLKITIEDLRLRLEAIESMPIFKTLKRLTKTNETKKG